LFVGLLLRQDFDKELPQDGIAQGEILLRGPWITGAYYRAPETASKFWKGWLTTGDIGSIDTEGNLIIRDRSKDVIKSGGEWISSVDMENLIVGLEGVEMCAVVAQVDQFPSIVDPVPSPSRAFCDEDSRAVTLHGPSQPTSCVQLVCSPPCLGRSLSRSPTQNGTSGQWPSSSSLPGRRSRRKASSNTASLRLVRWVMAVWNDVDSVG